MQIAGEHPVLRGEGWWLREGPGARQKRLISRGAESS